MNIPSNETLAYVAGLFDGEGSISIIKNSISKDRVTPAFGLVIAIANNDEEIHKFIKNIFGGTINSSNKWHRTYQWKLGAKRASDFLKSILPFLRIKKERAIMAIKFQEEKMEFTKKHLSKNKFNGGDRIPVEEVNRREIYRENIHKLNFENRRYISLN